MNKLNLRIIHTHDTPENWSKDTAKSFRPKKGEFIVYDNSDYATFKIGDGTNTVEDLPFAIDAAVSTLLNARNGVVLLDGGEITVDTEEESE